MNILVNASVGLILAQTSILLNECQFTQNNASNTHYSFTETQDKHITGYGHGGAYTFVFSPMIIFITIAIGGQWSRWMKIAMHHRLTVLNEASS